MSVEENKAKSREFVDRVFNRRDLSAIDEFIAPGYVDHDLPPGVGEGVDGLRGTLQAILNAFPDLQAEVVNVIGEGDRVVIQRILSGTQQGELLGMPASGKSMRMDGIDIVRYVDGWVAEHWGNQDDPGMIQQLGFMPQR